MPVQTVVETTAYLRKASKLMSAGEMEEVATMISENPRVGDLIAGTGGFRKVRIALQGGGKSGGARVVYYFYDANAPVFLIQVYAKNEKANITAAEKNALKMLSEEFKRKRGR